MRNTKEGRLPGLGRAEKRVLDFLWTDGPATAEACRRGVRSAWPMKEFTMRTVLRRLEEKGYVTHTVEGRAFVYRAAQEPARIASRATKQIIDRFCNGSAEDLVIGLVDHDVLTPEQLKRLARLIADRRKAGGR